MVQLVHTPPPNYRVAQANHLLLLVGTNPLPNAVAASLLVRSQGTVHLLCSVQTERVARRLQEWLTAREVDTRVVPDRVDEADPVSVSKIVTAWYHSLPKSVVIALNYTGGTKVMAVHARRVLQSLVPDPDTNLRLSYLSSDTLDLYIEGESTPRPVGRAISLTVNDVLHLHAATNRERLISAKQGWSDALGANDSDAVVESPNLSARIAHAVQRLANEGVFNDCYIVADVHSIEVHERTHFDALATRGYQLFAFLGTRERKTKAKLDLFEAYQRARQIGGDEARVALIHTYSKDDSRPLRDDMSSIFGLPARREGQDPLNVMYASPSSDSDLYESIRAWITGDAYSLSSATSESSSSNVALAKQPDGVQERWAAMQVDYLFLLVGENPLPNAVAARLLLHPEGELALIHTDRTEAIAKQMGEWARQWSSKKPRLIPFDSSGSRLSTAPQKIG